MYERRWLGTTLPEHTLDFYYLFAQRRRCNYKGISFACKCKQRAQNCVKRNVKIQLAMGRWHEEWCAKTHSCVIWKVWQLSEDGAMQRSGSQSDRIGVGAGSSFVAKSSASEHSMSTGVSASSSGGTLPRTLSTSVLRIKTRSSFWEKFWDERTKRDT